MCENKQQDSRQLEVPQEIAEQIKGMIQTGTDELKASQEAKNLITDMQFAIGVADDKVFVSFSEPIRWFGLTRDQAETLGRILIDRAKGILP